MIELDTDIHTLSKQAEEYCAKADWQRAVPVLQRLWQLGFKPELTALALGNVSMNRSMATEAMMWYRRVLALNPRNYVAHENLIFMVDAQPETTEDESLDARRGWWEHIGKPAYARRPHTYLNERDPEKRLRVGYVSGDFNFHSAAIAWAPVAAHHTAQIEPIFYCTSPAAQWDEVTHKHWKDRWGGQFIDVSMHSASRLAQGIYHDKVDILVDLSGYTRNNRLLTFSEKPAPIQVQAWGYVLGTASPAIDYILGDPVVCSPQVRRMLHEKVIDLPALLSYLPRPDLPEPNELPCTRDDQPITFAVFQRAMKVNADCLNVWREILERIPRSRLVFKAGDYSPEKRGAIVKEMASVQRQIHFEYPTDHKDHMLTYQSVDLSLDPWPQTGGVSTLESLWMGVPCVTLLGPRMIQRASASFLTVMGYGEDCIAHSREDYVSKAIKLVTYNRGRLIQIRQEARKTMQASPIMTGYVEAVEQRYRELWRSWCAAQEEAAA
jgi:predicted O-linked N-acetylglucosamine transferase (SPINDLY family)